MSERWRRVLSGEDDSSVGRAARFVAAGAEPVYAAAMSARNLAFDRGWRRVVRLARPTISVGNITAGGTGKTPMVLHLCRWLLSVGHRPAVLMRGYHGGDEAMQLTAELGPPVMVAANPDRALAARQVLQQRPQTTVFVLDDGFQRRQVDRMVDLVLVDATCPAGLGHVLPRGLLRERLTGLRRADAVVVTRCDQVSAPQLAEVDELVDRYHGLPPLAHAQHAWTSWRADGNRQPVEAIAGRRVAAVAGIGNPGSLQHGLRVCGAQLVKFHALPDHHAYTRKELAAFMQQAAAGGAEVVVTTEKDYVKWRPLLSPGTPSLPVWRPVLEIRFSDGWADVADLIAQRVPAPG